MSLGFKFYLIFYVLFYHAYSHDSGIKNWGNTQQIMLPDPKVDFALRIKAIEEATKSVEMISYSLTTTGILGPNFVRALQGALSRGVKGSFFITMSGLSPGDIKNSLERYLMRPGDNSEIYNALSPLQLSRVWNKKNIDVLDAFHEKILIIDRDTPYEKIWFGGRGIADFDLQYLDYAFVVTPLDLKKPYLGTLIKEAYDRVTQEIRAELQPAKSVKADKNLAIETVSSLNLDGDQQKKFNDLYRTLTSRAFFQQSPAEKICQIQDVFYPQKYRLLSNDYFRRLRDGSYNQNPKDLNARDLVNTSELSAFYKEVLAEASSVMMTTMFYFPPKEIRHGLSSLVDQLDGTPIRILTNSKESTLVTTPKPFAFYYSLDYLSHFSEHARVMGGNVKFCFIKSHVQETKEKYMHAKILYTPEQVVTGSHNHNLASEHRNNETVVVLYDKMIIDWFAQFLEKKMVSRFRCLDPKEFYLFYMANFVEKQTTLNGSSLNPFLDDFY